MNSPSAPAELEEDAKTSNASAVVDEEIPLAEVPATPAAAAEAMPPLAAVVAPAGKPDSRLERRAATRYPLHWRAAISIVSQGDSVVYQGRTVDVSSANCSIVVDRNLAANQKVTIFLELPDIHTKQAAKVIEIEARIVFVTLSGKYDAFFVNVQFVRFKGDGVAQLKARLG